MKHLIGLLAAWGLLACTAARPPAPAAPLPMAETGGLGPSPPSPTTTSFPSAASAGAEPGRPESAVGGVLSLAIDPARSRASYAVEETFINQDNRRVTTVGSTHQVAGWLKLNLAEPAQSEFGAFTADLSTLASDSRRRDEALRQDWLQSARYPTATFVVRTVLGFPARPAPGEVITFQLVGELTVRETTRTVTWDVAASLQGEVLAGQARTHILMSDFGVEPPNLAGILTVRDDVTLTVDFVMLPVE